MKKMIQLALFVLCISANANGQMSTAKWQGEPLRIDGSFEDWGKNLRFFNSDSRIHYEFRNDDKNLYLVVRTTDQTMQRQLVLAGMKLKFKVKSDPIVIASMEFSGLKMMNQNKGRKGGSGKQFPKDRQMESETDRQQPSDKLDETGLKPEFRPRDSVVIEGFQFSREAIFSDNIAPNTICFAKNKREMRPDLNSRSNGNNESVYEICIPLREFFGDNYSLDKIATIPIQLQVTIEGSTQGSRGSGMRGHMRGSGGGPGMGGPGGGEGMGGPGGGGPGGGEEMGGGEMGERPEPEGEGSESAMTKKSFNASFLLSTMPI